MRRTLALAATILAFAGPAARGQEAPQKSVIQFPDPDPGVEAVPVRAEAQRRTAGQFGVDHDFRFTDRRAQSGITFEHRAVEDSGRHWKPVHYDHGNGVSVADVDGDGLHDVYFLSQLGGNELWRNLGGGRFENVTARAGVALVDRVSVAAAFGDIDNDGDADLFVTTVRMGNVLFTNDGTGRFTDVSKAAGVDHVGHSSGALFLDYDLDGRLDLLVVNVGRYTTEQRGTGGFFVGLPDAFFGHLHPDRTERSLLYRNLGGGRFEEVAEKVGLVEPGWTGDATLVDLDADRYPEIYFVNMQGDDHYWDNRSGSFVERTAALFPKTPWGAMGVKFFDADNDGLADLLVTDMHSDMAVEVGPDDERRKSVVPHAEEHYADAENNLLGNALYVAQRDGSFRESSDAMGLENYWPWGVSVEDLNADGWLDVFIASSMNYPFRYGINSVLLNDRGKAFRPSEFLLGVEPRADGRHHKPWFDLDCGGLDQGHALCAGRTGSHTVLGAMGTRSSAIFDLDRDGDLDIVTSEFHALPQILLSDLAERRPVNALEVTLEGTASNRDGLGARVTVRAGSLLQTRYHDGKSGYLSQSLLPLYFGLGDAPRADRVEVLWPSGRTSIVEGEALSSRRVQVREGE